MTNITCSSFCRLQVLDTGPRTFVWSIYQKPLDISRGKAEVLNKSLAVSGNSGRKRGSEVAGAPAMLSWLVAANQGRINDQQWCLRISSSSFDACWLLICFVGNCIQGSSRIMAADCWRICGRVSLTVVSWWPMLYQWLSWCTPKWLIVNLRSSHEYSLDGLQVHH